MTSMIRPAFFLRFILSIIGTVIFLIPVFSAAGEWTMAVSISVPEPAAEGGVFRNVLEVGVHPSATDLYDNEWDVLSLTSGPVEAEITHEGEEEYAPALQSLWRDIRSEGLPQIWRIVILSYQSANPITMSWSPQPYFSPGICSQAVLQFRDEISGTMVDLTAGSSFSMPSTGSPAVPEIRRFALNLLSVPINALPAPLGLTAGLRGVQIALDWEDNPSPGLAGYHVWRSRGDNRSYEKITSQPVFESRFSDRNVHWGEAVYYRVTAVSALGCESDYSNEAAPFPVRRGGGPRP